MRDLPWRPYLHGREVRHKHDVLRAYQAELDSLLSTVLREVKEGEGEWVAAQNATSCRALLEWKRPCLFVQERLGVSLATYVDDIGLRGQRAQAGEAFKAIPEGAFQM